MIQRICLGLACLAATTLLSACSVSNCLQPRPYMAADRVPALESPPGLDVPPPDPDMMIPEVDGGPVGRYKNPPAGMGDSAFAHCLIAPPPMPSSST